MLCVTAKVNTVISSQCSVDFASALFLSAANLLLIRYANFVYLGLDAHWLISTYLLRVRLQASLLVGMVCREKIMEEQHTFWEVWLLSCTMS